MKIANEAIVMNSSRAYLEKDEMKENLRVWVDQPQEASSQGVDRITISREAEQLLDRNDSEIGEAGLEEGTDREISLKKLIVEILMGRKIDAAHFEKVKRQDAQVQDLDSAQVSQNGRQGWGLQYDASSTHHEKEDVSFRAKGIIQTADGKQIAFTLQLDMSREYLEESSVRIRAGDAPIDPLILNFDGKAAELTDLKFGFDLNSDGKAEQISMPTAGRGFLALDRNRDGIINNGSELFGPITGNGFAELQKYDKDGNSWIDENDDIFNRLTIMSADRGGASSLQTLHDEGVGAIYLGKESTRFDVRGTADNALLGQVRTTGIYLKEDGTPDTIQQLDLVA